MYATVITDYSVHQMWIYPNVDCYFVAREEMKTERRQLSREQRDEEAQRRFEMKQMKKKEKRRGH